MACVSVGECDHRSIPVSLESVRVGSQPGAEGSRLAEAEGSLPGAAGSPAVEGRPVEAHCCQ